MRKRRRLRELLAGSSSTVTPRSSGSAPSTKTTCPSSRPMTAPPWAGPPTSRTTVSRGVPAPAPSPAVDRSRSPRPAGVTARPRRHAARPRRR
ncbi:hypothetical protein CXF32_10580 [Corynebacterium bovis]|nr:hypothetical protein CXF32_10580 [Corynebacterium bovis]RRO93582.1 hypothetical protein CXF31_10980 [Corynebacterium bovis]